MKYQINQASDWSRLAESGLTTVVDPMVFRAGELFLSGSAGVADPQSTWEFLSANLHGIGMFFDRLVLDAGLPVFNYGDTFDAQLDFDDRVLTRINDHEELLFEVDVAYEAYHAVKAAALQEVEKLYEGDARVDAQLAVSVLGELAAAEYGWSPDLGGLGERLPSEQERRLAAFLLGGQIFGGYAQQLRSEVLLQPKRSRLFLAVSLGASSARHDFEEELFRELKARARVRSDDLPWYPTFFPYLLSRADTPDRMLAEAVALRRSSAVADYRAWLAEVMREWKMDGRIRNARRQDVVSLAQAVDRLLGTGSWAPKVEMKLTLADVATPKLPGELDLTPTLKALWGWTLDALPGKRYRKLLARAIMIDREYVELGRRVERVWTAPG